MAWLGIYFNYVDVQEHAIIMPGSVCILPPYTREKKTIWTMLGSNPARQLRKRARYPFNIASRARHSQIFILDFAEIHQHRR